MQGRGDAADEVIADARAVAEAGAFSVVLEMVPGDVTKRITNELAIPTIGIGAGPDADAQVLVWQDMAGLRQGPMPRFVKRYAELADVLSAAAVAVRRRGPLRRIPRRRAHVLGLACRRSPSGLVAISAASVGQLTVQDTPGGNPGGHPGSVEWLDRYTPNAKIAKTIIASRKIPIRRSSRRRRFVPQRDRRRS